MMHDRNGFTLMEMSTVLLIIAFLIGGLFAGQSVIRASQLHTVLTEYDSYSKAINEFQDKFIALPGDMKGTAGYTPQDMWGTDLCGCPCATSSTRTIKTCNGDGNGTIGTSDTNATLSNSYEWYRGWQQLADSGFIQNLLTGTPGSGGIAESVIGQNVPASAYSSAGWTLLYFLFPNNGAADNGVLWRDQYGHILTFGGYTSGSYTITPILKPEDAVALDQKIDDGSAGRGRVRAWRTSRLASCTTNDTSQDAQTYATSNTALSCSLVFLLGF